MSKFLRLTGLSGHELLIRKDLVIVVETENASNGKETYRKVITNDATPHYHVKDSIDVILTQLEED